MSKAYSQYKINNQTILHEHIDENYEPTEDEIHEYATYIGIDPDKELDLLWLAKEGLMKPLPSGWKACQEENGELYYFNFDTGKSSWDHPYDEIYKTRVSQAREKKSLATIIIDTHSKGKNTLSISDLSSEKNLYNVQMSGKNETGDNHCDSQGMNSGSDVELDNSENDNGHSSNGFQKDVDFGIDPQLSARIHEDENEPLAVVATSHPMSSTDPIEDNERVKFANLAAQAAERRLSANKLTNDVKFDLLDNNHICFLFTQEPILITPREDIELTKLRKRLEQSANEEKLQLLEDNRIYIEKLKTELQLTKEQEERTLRDKMKSDLTSIEKNLQENLSREKKLLMTRQQNELNTMKQNIEKEKQELQKKLRADMLSDLNLEQQDNVNMQIRLLQIKHEFEEKLRNAENRYKSEIEDLTRRFEKAKIDKDTLDKRLKEKNDFCSTMQRTMEQLRGEKLSLERKLQDTEAELKTIDSSQRQVQSSHTRKSSTKHTDNDDDNSLLDQTFSNNKNTFLNNNDNDDDDGLSDTDSDIIEMQQTLTALKHMSFLPTPNISMNNNKKNEKINKKSTTIDFVNNDISPILRNIPFERTLNSSLIDSGRWSNTMPSNIGNNTYPLGIQTMQQHQPSVSKNNYWQSQPSLITREAVLKAARDVLPPGVIDHLTSTN
ncbi:unnamed protein product [Adineta steineri]|uniref:WW domain-containing protein n=1 Tax=Adineta steineri TaxID=433720 RepID=A0A815TSW8_9BILA|nr:unnamed protein product [Adineta steineri]CAF1504864.1 unnamed protein product [Adineta steineri]